MPFTPTRNSRHPIPPTPDPDGNRPAAWHPAIHGHYVINRIPSIVADDTDVVLVDRGDVYERYVTGIVSASDPTPTEWVWGHYFNSLRDATRDLLER
jgi:hypothetical protein